MSLLREYIRTLLTEVAKGPDDLIAFPGATITIVKIPGGSTEFSYDSSVKGRDGPWGHISIVKAKDKDHGPCGDAYMISGVMANKGWGPLLYDIAMEYATLNGGGLVPDRMDVSTDARKVWSYYLRNRSEVVIDQLDNMQNTLTPDPEDNCEQLSAHFDDDNKRDYETHFKDSPISKRYSASPALVIPILKKAGRWVEE